MYLESALVVEEMTTTREQQQGVQSSMHFFLIWFLGFSVVDPTFQEEDKDLFTVYSSGMF